MERLRYLLASLLLVFAVYGFCFPELPVVNADELWETSRAYHLKTHHHPGEPILPREVSPFYSSVENLPWQGWFLGTVKQGSFALMMGVFPGKEWMAMRLTMFVWTTILCVLTFLLARKLRLSTAAALLAVTLLAFLPDLFSQVHRERSEIIIAVFLVALFYWMIGAVEEKDENKRSRKYFLIGLCSWLPSFLVHPSAIIIPPVIGSIYLLRDRKAIFSRNTFLIGIGLIAGAVFFLYLMNAVRMYAELSGGGNYFKYQGPPMLVRGWKYVVAIPAAFYFKFIVINPISRPVSFLLFIAGFVFLFLAKRKYPQWLEGIRYPSIMITVFLSLILLYLLSGSFGNYNSIVAPFIVIIIAGYLERWYNQKPALATSVAVTCVLISLSSAAWSLPENKRAAREYEQLLNEVDSVIPKSSEGIMGLALYYPPFKDRRFYSNSWFNRDAGIDGQSFEDAITKLKVSHVIVDDAFVGRAVLDRGKGWTDSMFVFLNTRCTVIQTYTTELNAGNRVPVKETYPPQWLYPEFKRGYIRKVVIFRLKEAE